MFLFGFIPGFAVIAGTYRHPSGFRYSSIFPSIFQRPRIGRSWTISGRCRSSREILRSARAEFYFFRRDNISPAWIPDTYALPQDANAQAIVKSWVNDAYGVGAVVLGHSITKALSSTLRIAICLPRAFTEYTFYCVQAAGWELHPIDDTRTSLTTARGHSTRRNI